MWMEFCNSLYGIYRLIAVAFNLHTQARQPDFSLTRTFFDFVSTMSSPSSKIAFVFTSIPPEEYTCHSSLVKKGVAFSVSDSPVLRQVAIFMRSEKAIFLGKSAQPPSSNGTRTISIGIRSAAFSSLIHVDALAERFDSPALRDAD
jgi:hypothetical protein